MVHLLFSACAVCATSLLRATRAQSIPDIFGQQDAVSAVPSNVAQYLLDIEAKGVYLHYFGDQQIFLLALSPNLREHLKTVASTSDVTRMPLVYGIDHLSADVSDWSKVLDWSSSSNGADAKAVFYGREIRQAPRTLYGNAIHLSLGPHEDPEGWTSDEMAENFKFWQAIHQEGQPVGIADGLRQFRQTIANQLGGTFMQRWGNTITTKAHRFVLQMYTAESQNEQQNPGALFFEMFPNNMPPTRQVMFFEAEDGCKGTPTPSVKNIALFEVRRTEGHRPASVSAQRLEPMFIALLAGGVLALATVLTVQKILRQHMSKSTTLMKGSNYSYEQAAYPIVGSAD